MYMYGALKKRHSGVSLPSDNHFLTFFVCDVSSTSISGLSAKFLQGLVSQI